MNPPLEQTQPHLNPLLEKSRPQFTLLGFDIFIRRSVLLAAAAAVAFFRGTGLVVAVALVISVLVHELGHSLAFRRYGSNSHIVVHLFGGYSLPHTPEKLSHRAWVLIATAGPLAAFFLLGLPGLALWFFDPFGWNGVGVGALTATVLIWFNVIWGLANLAPIWPLDGGRILYHSTRGNWHLTRTATVSISAIGAAIAWQFGFVFVAFFLAFNAFQIWNARNPQIGAGTNGQGTTTERPVGARQSQFGRTGQVFDVESRPTNQPPPPNTGHVTSPGSDLLDRVYFEIVRGRHDRADEPLRQLAGSPHHLAAEEAAGWARLLQDVSLETQPTTPLLSQFATIDTTPGAATNIAQSLRFEMVSTRLGPALVLLQRRGLLGVVARLLATDDVGRSQLQQLERITLDLGLVDEQMLITGVLDTGTALNA